MIKSKVRERQGILRAVHPIPGQQHAKKGSLVFVVLSLLCATFALLTTLEKTSTIDGVVVPYRSSLVAGVYAPGHVLVAISRANGRKRRPRLRYGLLSTSFSC